jgi:hypothetical protein
MYVSRQQSAFSWVTITVSSDLFILHYIRTNYLITKQKKNFFLFLQCI